MPVPNNIPIPGLATDNVDFSDFSGGNPYSQYGPSSNNTQFVTGTEGSVPDEFARNIKPTSTIRSQDNDINAVQNQSYGGVGPTLAYPLENSNPAYQARVTFTMKTFAPKVDGKNQKKFTSTATDNLKFVAKSDDVVRTERTDDIDLGFGDMKLKQGGGDAGHKGVRSISQHLGTKNFNRIRMGIGRPREKEEVSSFVLSNFSKAERDKNQILIKSLCEDFEKIIQKKTI